MEDRSTLSTKLQELLNIKRTPIALTFVDEPPRGVAPLRQSSPAGCSFWKMAAEGHVFYTSAQDYHNCVVGAVVHGIPAPEHGREELIQLTQKMVGVTYTHAEDFSGIPVLKRPFHHAVYGPLATIPCAPDVVIFRGSPRQVMLASEAALALGLTGSTTQMTPRPTCSIIADVMGLALGTSSFACIGNRVYTDLDDEELYFAISGTMAPAFVEKLETIIESNRELENYHRNRQDVLGWG